MKKDIESDIVWGDLFSPKPQFFSRNSGLIEVSGWFRREASVEIIRIQVGKRIVEREVAEIAYEESILDAGIRLFRFQLKVGTGPKKLVFSMISKAGIETRIATRHIWQKNRVTIPAEEPAFPVESTSYQTWLLEDEKSLRSIRFSGLDQEICFPVNVAWILELGAGNLIEIEESLASIFAQHGSVPNVVLLTGDRVESDWLGFQSLPNLTVCCVDDLNQVIGSLASDWIGFLREGDRVCPDLQKDFSSIVSGQEDLKLFYTDYDYVEGEGHAITPVFLPGWNRDLHTSIPYLSNSFLIKKSTYLQAGGIYGQNHSSRWDLTLRASRICERNEVDRLCGIYFHLRRNPSVQSAEAISEATQMLQTHVSELGEAGEVIACPENGSWRIKREACDEAGVFPKVSLLNIIIICIKEF